MHDQELTYAVVSNDWRYFPGRGILGSHLPISLGLKKGLDRLGLELELASGSPRSGSPRPAAGRNHPCFAASSRYELVSRGRKLVGSAQRRLKRSFLQHGSIPLRVNPQQMARVFRSREEILRTRVTSVEEAAGRHVPLLELQEALRLGLEEHFQVSLATGKVL